MKIAMSYRDGPDGETVSDHVVDDDNPSFDAMFAGVKSEACVGIRVGLKGGVTVEISAEEILEMIKAGFNL